MYNVREIFLQIDADIERHQTYLIGNQKLRMRELHNLEGEVFFVAAEPENKKKLLILPAYKRFSAFDLQRFPSCKGMQLTSEKIDKIGPFTDQWCLILRQTGNYDNSIYESFIINICETLWPASSAAVIREFQKTMQKWQHFFSKLESEGLTPEQRRGLFGELELIRWLLQNETHPEIVRSWRGPSREDVDFIFGHVGVEVKTTLTREPIKVRISNERQLAGTSDTDAMYLAVSVLNLSHSVGDTLNQVIADLRNELNEWPLYLQAFEDQLLNAGYVDAHADQYRNERYLVLERRLYKVEEDFPRIDSTTLASGIVNVKYDIILNGYDEYRVDDSSFIKVIQET